MATSMAGRRRGARISFGRLSDAYLEPELELESLAVVTAFKV